MTVRTHLLPNDWLRFKTGLTRALPRSVMGSHHYRPAPGNQRAECKVALRLDPAEELLIDFSKTQWISLDDGGGYADISEAEKETSQLAVAAGVFDILISDGFRTYMASCQVRAVHFNSLRSTPSALYGCSRMICRRLLDEAISIRTR